MDRCTSDLLLFLVPVVQGFALQPGVCKTASKNGTNGHWKKHRPMDRSMKMHFPAGGKCFQNANMHHGARKIFIIYIYIHELFIFILSFFGVFG